MFKAEPRLLFGTPCWELEVSTPHQGCVCPCSLFAPEPDDVPGGSCFSSRSAPGRLMMGLEGWGGSIFAASLPMMVGRVCGRYELTSPIVPVRTASCRSRNSLNLLSALPAVHAACGTTAVILLLQRNSVPSSHMRCRTTARRLATATMARRMPRRWATRMPHAFSHDHFCRTG
jgi:hypothetical protein